LVSMVMMILVTGAAGKTGRSVLRALVEKGIPVRALVHRPDQVPAVETCGAQEVMIGDMNSAATMAGAMRSIQAVYHICPNVSPDEVSIGQVVITAAQTAGVDHFVFHSVLKPQTEAMPHHWKKMRVEEQLIESGLPYTILQPAAYMQNISAHWESMLSEGIYPVPYPAETSLSLVDLEDVAQAAAIVLTEPDHQFATYELVGSKALSQSEVAAILSHELGRPVQVSVVSLETWQAQARDAGLGEYQILTLIKMFQYYREHGFFGNPQVLGWLLERPATSFSAFVKRIIRERLERKSN
jgi:uncharacterized protein YbjT (DUF2867 family)